MEHRLDALSYEETIGRRIRAVRRSLNLRQVDLSEMAGIPASHLSDIERGVLTPTIPTLHKISEALNRPLVYFLQADGDQRQAMGMVIHLESLGGQAARHFAERVREKTGGALNVRLYHHSQLGTAFEQVQGLAEGAIDIYVDELLSFERYAPLCGPVCLPYFFRDRAHYNRFLESGLFEQLINQKLLDNGIRLLRPLVSWESGSYEMLLTDSPVFTPGELAGRRFRSYNSSAATALRTALGAEPVVVEWARTPDAFCEGKIDTFLVPAAYLDSIEPQAIAEYATLLDYGYTINLSVAVNEREYQKLPPDVQAALNEAAQEAGVLCTQMVNERTAAMLEGLARSGLPVIHPEQAVWRAAFDDAIRRACLDGGLMAPDLYKELQSL